jgi:hypothetical protein
MVFGAAEMRKIERMVFQGCMGSLRERWICGRMSDTIGDSLPSIDIVGVLLLDHDTPHPTNSQVGCD